MILSNFHSYLLTRPVLCDGRPIIFTLRGVTNKEDIHRQTPINIEKIYEKLVPEYEEQKWDLSIDSLKRKILSLDKDHPDKQTLLEQLNQLTLQPLIPSE